MTPCEQYMVAMKDLKDSAEKFQSMIFLAEFKGKMNELKRDIDHLCAACEELKTSTRFQAFLAMSLKLVNKINTGDDGGATVTGFSLDSLTKLSETKAFDNKTTVLQYLVKVIRKTNKDVLRFREDIKSVVLAKGVMMERVLASAKQLCEDSRIVTETAKKDGEEYRKFLNHPTDPKYKCRNNVQAQRASVNELRQMATFLSEKDVPVGQTDSTHFERFALFSKLELQKTLLFLANANQNYIGVLEYFGEDTKTQASDFFAMIDHFMAAFDQALDFVEKEERLKMMEVRRRLAKEAKLKVKAAALYLMSPAASEARKEWSTEKCRTISDAGQSKNKAAPKDGGIAAMVAAAARKRDRQRQSPVKSPLLPFETEHQSPPADGSLIITTAEQQKDKERQQMTWKDEKWAKRPDRLAIRINADQERVEMEVKKTHQSELGRLAATSADRNLALANSQKSAKQQQKKQAGRLMAEALAFKQKLTPNPELASALNSPSKRKETIGPSKVNDEHDDAKILNKLPSGKAQEPMPKASIRSEAVMRTPVTQVAVERSLQSTSTVPRTYPSRLSMAVAAAAHQRKNLQQSQITCRS